MQKDKRVVLVLWAAWALGAWALAGCGGDARSDLAKATDKAKRLYDSACSFLNDPVYKIDGKYAPLTERREDLDERASRILALDANDPAKKATRDQLVQEFPMELAPFGALNPKAEKALAQAAKELSAALSAAGEATTHAEVADKARAHAVLARVYALEADRRAILAAEVRNEAWTLLRQMENEAIAMGDHGKRIANCDELLSVSDPSLGKMADQAKTDLAAAKDKIAQLNKQIEAHKTERVSLSAANEKLLAEARDLRIKSQLAGPIEGIEVFDQARDREGKATANSVRITELEDTVQFLALQVATLESDVAAAQERGTVAGEMAGRRQQRQEKIRQERGGYVKLLSDTQQEVETLAGKVIDACKKVKQEEDAALDAYAKAKKQYDQYKGCTQKTAPAEAPELKSDPGVVAMSGDLLMRQGDLRVRALSLQKRIDEVVAGVRKLWTGLPVQKDVPNRIPQVSGYVTDAQKMKEDAQNDFRWAADDYKAARVLVPERNLHWLYHLQIAAAYTALYRLSADDQYRKMGSDALGELKKAEGSPYVAKHAAHFRNLLAGDKAPPAPPPTAPAP